MTCNLSFSELTSHTTKEISSALEPEQLDRLITALKGKFDFTTVKEFTVEAGRADSITREKLEVLYRHQVSRISVNPQTMKQETLDIIGRKASVEQVLTAYRLAREVGFDNINMDLILGLPGELEADVQRTIEKIVELSPDSLTVHSLAIKRASRLNQWIQENGVSMLHNTDETMKIAAAGAEKLGMKLITSTDRRTCPAISRTPATPVPANMDCTTSSSWRRNRPSWLWEPEASPRESSPTEESSGVTM